MDAPVSDRLSGAFCAASGFGIPFLLVLYLAFASGGYDLVSRSQVGLIVWWAVLLGILIGVLPAARVTTAGRVALTVVGALLLWTAAGTLIWTESTERSVVELSRVATLGGIFFLLVLIQRRDGLRYAVTAIAAAVAIVSLVSLLDRFHPDLLPFGTGYTFPDGYPRARLNYPLEYWNGLAIFVAMGVAPLLWIVSSGRTVVGRAVAAGALPVLALTGYLTASRGGVVEGAVVLLVMVVLFPRRLLLLLNLLVPAAGSILLVVLVNRRPELRDLVPGDLASTQGTQMTWLTLVVFAVAAGAQAGAILVARRFGLRLPEVSRGLARGVGIAAGAAAALAVVVVLVSGFASDKWSEFKVTSMSGTVERFGNLNSGERYRIWDSAVDAAASEKVTGIGPGAFEYWWTREGDGQQFVRDGHSIYLEGLAEMGPVGFILVIALVLGPLGLAAALALRRGLDERRALLAAAGAGMAAFAVGAGIDWAWELTVLPVMFFVLTAGVVGSESAARMEPETVVLPETSVLKSAPSPRSGTMEWRWRIPVMVGALMLMVLIAIPMMATNAVRDSQAAFRAGDVDQSLDDARRATSLQPYSTSAKVQEAQVLAAMGRKEEAADVAREATAEEPVNWRNWLVLSQIASGREARDALIKARDLNPRSPVFAEQ